MDDRIEGDLEKMGNYLLTKAERTNAALHTRSILDVCALLSRALAELQRRRSIV